VPLSAIFAHLFTVYGRISPQQLTANDAALNKPWDPRTPFEILIDRIEDCIDFATDGGVPSTDAQILNSVYTLVFNTGLYFDDTKIWNLRPAIKKNLGELQNSFFASPTRSASATNDKPRRRLRQPSHRTQRPPTEPDAPSNLQSPRQSCKHKCYRLRNV
jgi:hypothetical protein